MKSRTSRRLVQLVLALAAVAIGSSASAVTIQDLARLKGEERNVLVGLGLVIGLDGTGDSNKDSQIAARPFQRLLANLGNPIELDQLTKANAIAIVHVTMPLPPQGVREGDELDVFVDKMFNAKSLRGGRLIASFLRPPEQDSPDLPVMAVAQGPLIVEGENVASARVRAGGQMLADVRTNPVAPDGTIQLVLKDQYAGWQVATALADAINEPDEFDASGGDYSRLAHVEDAKNVRVRIPHAERSDPSGFIAWVMSIVIDPSLVRTEARVVINEAEGIISVSANVELGPVAITHKGMQLNSLPPTGGAVGGGGGAWQGLDTTDRSSRSSTRLVDLLAALNQIKVPVEDQIAILYELKRSGALFAEITHR